MISTKGPLQARGLLTRRQLQEFQRSNSNPTYLRKGGRMRIATRQRFEQSERGKVIFGLGHDLNKAGSICMKSEVIHSAFRQRISTPRILKEA